MIYIHVKLDFFGGGGELVKRGQFRGGQFFNFLYEHYFIPVCGSVGGGGIFFINQNREICSS